MQALISLPAVDDGAEPGSRAARLFQRVAGIPLLARVIATAWNAGATSVLIVHSHATPEGWLRARLRQPFLSTAPIRFLAIDHPFDPNDPDDWRRVADRIEPTFVWLPWNFVAVGRVLAPLFAEGGDSDQGARLVPAAAGGDDLSRPARIRLPELLALDTPRLGEYVRISSLASIDAPAPGGIAVDSTRTRRVAVRLLVQGAGKSLDGFYSRFNRRLCRPFVRWLSHTPVTPNMVTLAGLPIVFLAGYLYARGSYGWYVLGALTYYASVLVDEVDGMLARTKFQVSPFGCWLESFVDYVSYLTLWSGMAVGLSRQYGEVWLVVGGLTLLGHLISFGVAIWHRKLSTRPDAPEKHVQVLYARLEADSANLLSRAIRWAHPIMKRGVFSLWVVLFSLMNAVPLTLALAAFGSHVTWILGLHTTRLYTRPPGRPVAGPTRAVPLAGQDQKLEESL